MINRLRHMAATSSLQQHLVEIKLCHQFWAATTGLSTDIAPYTLLNLRIETAPISPNIGMIYLAIKTVIFQGQKTSYLTAT